MSARLAHVDGAGGDQRFSTLRVGGLLNALRLRLRAVLHPSQPQEQRGSLPETLNFEQASEAFLARPQRRRHFHRGDVEQGKLATDER